MEKLLRGVKKKTIGKICKAIGGAILALSLAMSNLGGMYPEVKAHALDPSWIIQMPTNGAATGVAANRDTYVYFGTYPQSSDGNGGYNIDPIKWKLLRNSNGQLFLLADQPLDCKKYNENQTAVTWETCTLRNWLNGTGAYTDPNNNFIKRAFSDVEEGAIADTEVVTPNNPDYGTSGGNNTTDNIFILSIEEAESLTYALNSSCTAYATSLVTPGGDSVDYFEDLKSAFDYAIALGGNQTVTWNRDCVLNYDIMKLLSENPSITLAFSYTYEDVDYKVTIPGRLAKPDPEIPIYGPLYLYGTYGGTAKKH